jgi:alpha-1,2-mannosyltransferase
MIAFGAFVFVVSVAALSVLNRGFSSQQWPMLDLQIYRWGGLIVRHSGDLYGSHFPHHHLRFTYPPTAAMIFAVLPTITMPTLRWFVLIGSIASLIMTLWLTCGMLGYRRSAKRIGLTLAAAGIALWFGPVNQTLAFGQINLLLMLIIVADLSQPDARPAKGIGVGLAASVKLTPLIFIPYLLFTRQFRAAGIASATFALTMICSLALLPRQSARFWFSGLFLDSRRIGNNAYTGNQSLHGTLARLLGEAPAAQPYWAAVLALVGVGGLLLAARAARRGREMAGILTCALTGLLISPISWAHHWVWVAPALVVAVDMAIRAQSRNPRPGWPPDDDIRWLSVWQRRLRSWRWALWAGVAALNLPFFALPQSLVPATVAQGTGAHGIELVTSNLYVFAGLAILCLEGLIGDRKPSLCDVSLRRRQGN